ncbi:MAG TPA: SPW repeat protein [Burkholderiaceae bacterium]
MQPTYRMRQAAGSAAGAALAMSPWLLGYERVAWATISAVATGLVLAMTCCIALARRRTWQPYVQSAAATWVLVSPWILGFGGQPAALIAALICGVCAALLALGELLDDGFPPPGETSRRVRA